MAITAHLSRLLSRLARPLLLVCAVMLAFGPIADGLACGLEPATAEAAVLESDHHDGDGGSTDPSHAICAHGHCHHASVLASGAGSQIAAVSYSDADHDAPLSVEPPSANLPTLKRPPRT